jgi:hypothetical protein
MKPIDALKLALVLVALAIWAWGIRANDNVFMLVGVGFMIAAFLLRFVPRKPRS